MAQYNKETYKKLVEKGFSPKVARYKSEAQAEEMIEALETFKDVEIASAVTKKGKRKKEAVKKLSNRQIQKLTTVEVKKEAKRQGLPFNLSEKEKKQIKEAYKSGDIEGAEALSKNLKNLVDTAAREEGISENWGQKKFSQRQIENMEKAINDSKIKGSKEQKTKASYIIVYNMETKGMTYEEARDFVTAQLGTGLGIIVQTK